MTEPDVPTPCMCFATPPVMRGRVVCECVDQTESDCNHPAAYIPSVYCGTGYIEIIVGTRAVGASG
jgi:hypothetical protein